VTEGLGKHRRRGRATRASGLCLALALVATLLAPRAWAGEPKVAEVKVEGNRRAEAEAVRGVLRTRTGQPLDPAVLSEDIRRVWSLGYFDDIEVRLEPGPEGSVLIFAVREKPAIRELRYEGLDELGEDDVKEVVDLQPFSVLDVAEVKRNAQKIRDLYTEKGYFLAEVDFALKPVSEHEVDVVFLVSERAKVRVKRIAILGNRAISDSELKENIATRERSFLSFVTSEGNFKREIFERDLLLLRAYYMNHGYVNVKVSSPEVTLAPDKENIFISIHVTEGPQFRIGKVELSGDFVGPREEVEALVKSLRSGDIFSQGDVFRAIERVTNYYKDRGYAYANVNPLTATDDSQLLVDLNLQIQKGSLVHIGRIEVVGNGKTRDKVVRRELRIYEGDLYSETGIKLSKRNVTRLGFFETVELRTQRGAGDDLIDLLVEVKERQTGTFQVGAGLSSVESVIGTAQISQNNLLGRGQSLSLQATLSGIRQYVNIHFGEPHFLDTNWLLSFDLFKYQYDFDDFVQGSTGGSVTLGYQLTDDLRLSFTYENARVEFERRSRPEDAESGLTSSVKGMLSLDTRDDRFLPNRGWYTYISEEVADAALGSENEFSRTIFSARYYHPLLWRLVAMTRLEYGLTLPLGDRPVPQFERFRVGGIQSVRGFRRLALSPEIWRQGYNPEDPLILVKEGGIEEVIFNFEVVFPIFEQVGIQGVVFHDMGMAYSEDGTILADPEALWSGLRASWGFGFRWFSPIGPLRFEWGFPYNPMPGEDSRLFEFTIGNF